jgi:cation transporter-like permease
MSVLIGRIIPIYIGCCGVAGAALGVNMSTHGHLGGSSSSGTLLAGIIGGALLGSTFGSVALPYVAVQEVYYRFVYPSLY